MRPEEKIEELVKLNDLMKSMIDLNAENRPKVDDILGKDFLKKQVTSVTEKFTDTEYYFNLGSLEEVIKEVELFDNGMSHLEGMKGPKGNYEYKKVRLFEQCNRIIVDIHEYQSSNADALEGNLALSAQIVELLEKLQADKETLYQGDPTLIDGLLEALPADDPIPPKLEGMMVEMENFGNRMAYRKALGEALGGSHEDWFAVTDSLFMRCTVIIEKLEEYTADNPGTDLQFAALLGKLQTDRATLEPLTELTNKLSHRDQHAGFIGELRKKFPNPRERCKVIQQQYIFAITDSNFPHRHPSLDSTRLFKVVHTATQCEALQILREAYANAVFDCANALREDGKTPEAQELVEAQKLVGDAQRGAIMKVVLKDGTTQDPKEGDTCMKTLDDAAEKIAESTESSTSMRAP